MTRLLMLGIGGGVEQSRPARGACMTRCEAGAGGYRRAASRPARGACMTRLSHQHEDKAGHVAPRKGRVYDAAETYSAMPPASLSRPARGACMTRRTRHRRSNALQQSRPARGACMTRAPSRSPASRYPSRPARGACMTRLTAREWRHPFSASRPARGACMTRSRRAWAQLLQLGSRPARGACMTRYCDTPFIHCRDVAPRKGRVYDALALQTSGALVAPRKGRVD